MISVAAGRQNIHRRHHPLDRLIVGLVEGIARRGRDHCFEPAPRRRADRAVHELHRGRVARDDLAEIDVSEIPVVVDDRVERVHVAQTPDDLKLLLVKRIADEIALNGEGILHETRGMEGADGLVVGDAGRDDLAAAGPAGHEMRLDQAGRDAQIRFDEAAVELDRRPARRGEAEIDMIGVVARVVVLDANPLHDPGIANQFGQFFADIRPMQTGRNQNDDAIERNA